jgi:hypothetical protein
MDIVRMLAELRTERERITEAILAVERLAIGGQKRRGRPPKWMAASKASTDAEPTTGKRRPFSAATRAKMAAAQKKRWTSRKKKAA